MTRHWKFKALAFIVGLGLLIYGITQLQTDPTLRVLKTLSIAELEGSKQPAEDQYIQVNDAFLLGPYVVKTSHSRKRGDSAYVFAPLGSKDLIAQALKDKPIKPALWVRLEADYKTAAGADAAMKLQSLYEKPYPVSGVVRSLESDVAAEMQGGNGKIQMGSPVSLHNGSSPMSLGAGAAFVSLGSFLWLLLAILVFTDHGAEKWLKALQEKSEGQVFQGRSALLYFSIVAALCFLAATSLVVSVWVNGKEFSVMGVLMALAALAVFVWGLLKSRAAAVLKPDVLELVRGDKVSSVPLTQVTALTIDERSVKGVTVASYTLHKAEGKPFEIGSTLFKGGLEDTEAFSLRLRRQLFELMAPQLFSQLEQGQTIAFSALNASQQGMGKGKTSNGADTLPWSEVASATLKNGELKIKQKGKMFTWGSFKVKKIHNLDVLLHVLKAHGVNT
jgi:hypothetical protein